MRDHSPRIRDNKHRIRISSFSRIRDEAVPFLWDQEPKFFTLLESTRSKMISATKKRSSS